MLLLVERAKERVLIVQFLQKKAKEVQVLLVQRKVKEIDKGGDGGVAGVGY